MKVKVSFRGESLGVAEAVGDGPVRYSGPKAAQVRAIALQYSGLRGEALLRRLLRGCRGNTRAEEVR